MRNHPYVDGNKRTGFIAAFTFLYINGYLIEAEQSQVVAFVLSVAAGEVGETDVARFLERHTVPLDSNGTVTP